MVILTFYYITSNITNFSSDLKTGRRTGSVMQWVVLEESNLDRINKKIDLPFTLNEFLVSN